MTNPPTAYPSNWRPPGSPPFDEPPNFEALALAVDAFIAALSPEEFDALVARTRNGAQQQPANPYGQPPAQPTQYGR
jgi:hypothetical protein